MNHDSQLGAALRSLVTVGALLMLAASGAGAGQDVPIVQPGAPGQKTTKLTAEQAVKLADARYTADDVTFMRDMIHHHDQAVQMAEMVKDRTNRPELFRNYSCPGGARDRLTHNMHVPDNENETTGALEAALLSTLACEPVQAKVDEAFKAGKLREMEELLRISEARDKGVITIDEALMLERDYALRRTVIMVDDYDPRQLAAGRS